MKSKFILSLILAFTVYLLSAQIPKGFNYQAIARNSSGEPISNQSLPVRITIQSDSLGGTAFWIELHSSVTTNNFGLFTLVLGKGIRQAGSTAAAFNEIDWTVTPKYIKTEIDFSGWKTMGSSRLWAVPYSMVSGTLAGPLSKLSVSGKTDVLDEALFEVKNKDGQTVFAVYNEGVRVYVDNGTKGTKGGFAIGGFGTTKASSQDYFVVNADSIRAYIYDNPQIKTTKGGFAIGGFDMSKGKTNNYLLISPDSARVYINNASSSKGTKGGFAIGGFDMTKGSSTQKLLTVGYDSIRMYINDNSKSAKGGFAIGGFSTTKGASEHFLDVATDASGVINPSQNRILWYPLKNAFLTGKVLIEKPDSVGENSFASGFESKAIGGYSQALGYKAIARGAYSTAIGKNAVANNINSFAFGEGAFVGNDEGYAIGRGAVATGYRSFAFGSASVDSSGVATDVTRATGDYSFSIGGGSQATEIGSIAIGIGDTAEGRYSFALGHNTNAFGWYSVAIGSQTKASEYGIAMGYQCETGYNSTAIGYRSTSLGQQSTAVGFRSSASSEGTTAIGCNATAYGTWSAAIGSSAAKGVGALGMGYANNAQGAYSTAMGRFTVANGRNSTAMGYYTTAASAYETVIGYFNSSYIADPNFSIPTDRLLVIGNGTSDTPSNALTLLKNGCIGLQSVTNPTYAFELPNNSDIGIGHARAYAWDTYSDDRIKTDKELLQYGLKEIMQLNPLTYFQHNSLMGNGGLKIEDVEKRDIGLLAQEVYKIIPEVVSKPKNEQSDLWSMSYEKLVPVLIKGMQEQQIVINKQQKEIDDLKILVTSLLSRMVEE